MNRTAPKTFFPLSVHQPMSPLAVLTWKSTK